MFLNQVSNKEQNYLAISQYIPLPSFQEAPKGEYEELFQQIRTPMFLLIFIGVLLVQIFYKQKKVQGESDAAFAAMGPLERSLGGRGPGGKKLDPKQRKEIAEIDAMIGQMGNLGKDLGSGMHK